MATALFMQMVTEMTEAHVDQEHIEMLIHSCPQIPDRTSFILDHTKADPKPEMIRVGRNLAEQGVDLIAVPCITSRYSGTSHSYDPGDISISSGAGNPHSGPDGNIRDHRERIVSKGVCVV